MMFLTESARYLTLMLAAYLIFEFEYEYVRIAKWTEMGRKCERLFFTFILLGSKDDAAYRRDNNNNRNGSHNGSVKCGSTFYKKDEKRNIQFSARHVYPSTREK
jgi:hypothetical protein